MRRDGEYLLNIYVSRTTAYLDNPLDPFDVSIVSVDSATSCAMACSSWCPYLDPVHGVPLSSTFKCDWWIYNSSV